MRYPLRKLLREAWAEVIQENYVLGRVNSESSLQAALLSELNTRLPNETRRLFVEPRFSMQDGGPIKPDIVICNTRAVIAVVELKYEPRRAPSLEKDLRNLHRLAVACDSMSLANDRYQGEVVGRTRYEFSAKTLYVWAGVYQAKDPSRLDPVEIDVTEKLADRFFSMHAVTSSSCTPAIHFV